jgi:hypothetical protein
MSQQQENKVVGSHSLGSLENKQPNEPNENKESDEDEYLCCNCGYDAEDWLTTQSGHKWVCFMCKITHNAGRIVIP